MVLRVAAFDAGTNTFRLLIADRDGGVCRPLRKVQRITRLGRGYQRDVGLAATSDGRFMAWNRGGKMSLLLVD